MQVAALLATGLLESDRMRVLLGVQLPFPSTNFPVRPYVGEVLARESFLDRKGLAASADIFNFEVAAVAKIRGLVYQAEGTG